MLAFMNSGLPMDEQVIILHLEQELRLTVKRLETAKMRQEAQMKYLRNENAYLHERNAELQGELIKQREMTTKLEATYKPYEQSISSLNHEIDNLRHKFDLEKAQTTCALKRELELKAYVTTLETQVRSCDRHQRTIIDLESLNMELEKSCRAQALKIYELKLELKKSGCNKSIHAEEKPASTSYQADSSKSSSTAKSHFSMDEDVDYQFHTAKTVHPDIYENEDGLTEIHAADMLQKREEPEKMISSSTAAQSSNAIKITQERGSHVTATRLKSSHQNENTKGTVPATSVHSTSFKITENLQVPPNALEYAQSRESSESNHSIFDSPASAMIREFLTIESNGEVLDKRKVLEISEKYARRAKGNVDTPEVTEPDKNFVGCSKDQEQSEGIETNMPDEDFCEIQDSKEMLNAEHSQKSKAQASTNATSNQWCKVDDKRERRTAKSEKYNLKVKERKKGTDILARASKLHKKKSYQKNAQKADRVLNAGRNENISIANKKSHPCKDQSAYWRY